VLEEIKDPRMIRLLRGLIKIYHTLGVPAGGGWGGRFFVWKVDGFICGVAWIGSSAPFRHIAHLFRIDLNNSYMIRRIVRTCPGDHLVSFLNTLAERLRQEGKEVLWTLGLDDHSNALYKKAGFELAGYTPKKGLPVFVRRLR